MPTNSFKQTVIRKFELLSIEREEKANQVQIPTIFVVCNQRDTAPVWGFILRQQGLNVILEHSIEKAIEYWSADKSDVLVLDIDADHHERMEICRRFRSNAGVPILLFLPGPNENQIWEAYQEGVDEVVIKPISPPIFLAKILAWARRRWTAPSHAVSTPISGKYCLNPARHCLVFPDGQEIKLTNLEFRLLQLLMSRPAFVFNAEDIIECIWGGFNNGDQILLKNVIYRLRKKIESDPSHPSLLQTWHGGYSFHG